jgi:hypothetical protein
MFCNYECQNVLQGDTIIFVPFWKLNIVTAICLMVPYVCRDMLSVYMHPLFGAFRVKWSKTRSHKSTKVTVCVTSLGMISLLSVVPNYV